MIPRRARLALSLSLLAAAACTDDPASPVLTAPDPSLLHLAQNAADVPTYSQERPGTFVDMSDEALWKHVAYSDSIAIVGLRKPGANRGVYKGRVLMDRTQWLLSRRAVLERLGVALIAVDTLLPKIKVKFHSVEAFRAVRRLPMASYVEPLRAIGDVKPHATGLFCATPDPWPGDRDSRVDDGPYELFRDVDGDVISNKHKAMGITNAWLRTGGAGATIGLVDTGIDYAQPQLLPASLGGRFDFGRSGGRSIRYRSVFAPGYDGPPHDECGHGTKMAAEIAAPRDGRSMVGVAWQSNLVAVRHANSFFMVNSDDAQHGVRLAVQTMDTDPGGKVIVMAWQSNNWYWQVSDEIVYWQNRHPNDLIFFAAAGTSEVDWKECTFGVATGWEIGTIVGAVIALFNPMTNVAVWTAIGTGLGSVAGCAVPANRYLHFPANHANVIAVTCVDYPVGNVSNNCHFGDKVEFAGYQGMPAVYGSSEQVVDVGGSSNATGLVGAQAALVWSKYPWMNRTQVLDRMRWAGRAVRDPDAGYQIVNAYKAVGGMYDFKVTSSEQMYRWPIVDAVTLTATFSGGDGPFRYQWSNGATTPSTVVYAQYFEDPDNPYTIRARIGASVTVTDLSDGGKLYAQRWHSFTEPPGGCITCVIEPPDGGGSPGPTP